MPKKQSELDAATSVADDDEMNIEQSGTSKRVPLGIVETRLPTSCIGGLITSNGTDADHDIDIAPGVARDDTDIAGMRLAAILTKQIDAAWAVGTNQGGLDEGSVVANQLYLMWLIKRSDTAVVDAIFSILGLLEKQTTVSVDDTDDSYNDGAFDLSIFKVGQIINVQGFTTGANNGLKTVLTSAANKITVAETLVTEAAGDVITIKAQVTGPTMPTDYDRKRLIAAIRTDGPANIAPYTQVGDYFQFHNHWAEIQDNAITSGLKVTGNLILPPRCLAHIFAGLENPTSTDPTDGRLWVWAKDVDESIGSNNTWLQVETASVFDRLNTQGVVFLDASSQFTYAAPEATGAAQVNVRTRGFTMLTRRDP